MHANQLVLFFFLTAGNCSGYCTCGHCLEQPGCGWCTDPSNTGKGKCIEGSYKGPVKMPSQAPVGNFYPQPLLNSSMCLEDSRYNWSFIHCPGKMSCIAKIKCFTAYLQWMNPWKPWPMLAQLVGASSHKPKDCRFNSQSGHIPRLLVLSPVGCMRKATNWCFSITLMFLSLPSLPFKINKHVFRWGLKKQTLKTILFIWISFKNTYNRSFVEK